MYSGPLCRYSDLYPSFCSHFFLFQIVTPNHPIFKFIALDRFLGMLGKILYHSQGPNWPCHITEGAPTDPLSVEIYIHLFWLERKPFELSIHFHSDPRYESTKAIPALAKCTCKSATWVEIVIATQWVRRTGQGQKHFEDDHSDAEADRSLHLTHRLSHLHSRLLDHRPCQVLLFRKRPRPQHVRLSYN